ncbi:MAG: hypothetical protein M3R06_03480 [Chloroflexota bacterium]|nr:hypothetical protein [Chloroflexota bacterium]
MMHPVRIAGFCVAALVLFVGRIGSVGAQDATPASGGGQFPLVPDPTGCVVEPRAADDLIALWFADAGTPAASPAAAEPMEEFAEVTLAVGPLADEATTTAVTEVVREVFDCFAAGDFGRATALFTDDLIREFGPEPGETAEDVRGFLEATPGPEEAAQTGMIVAITDVMLLEDGRVAAFVVDETEGVGSTVYVLFEQDGDRWLVDEVTEFSFSEEDEG